MSDEPTPFVLGGHQSDFARNAAREGLDLTALMGEAARGALASARLDATEVGVAHVGNFAAEIYSGQGHLGSRLPTSCAVAVTRSSSARPGPGPAA